MTIKESIAPAAQPAPAPAVIEPKEGALASPAAQPAPAPESKAEPPKEGDDTTILGAKPKEEGKPAGESKPPVKQEAPEKYADFALPEGVTMDKAMLEKASAEFKAMNLSQEQAQKLVTIQAEHAKAMNAEIINSFKKQVSDWKDQTVKLYGNEFEKKSGVAAAAIDRFGSPELRQLLNDTGLGNHPDVVKFFVSVGEKMAEDQPGEGKKPQGEKSTAELLYGSTMTKKS